MPVPINATKSSPRCNQEQASASCGRFAWDASCLGV
jgi:hypothetical protein